MTEIASLILCHRCQVMQDTECFKTSKSKSRGYQSYCIPCMKEYHKDWYLKRRGPLAVKDRYLPALRGRLRHLLKCRTVKHSRERVDLDWAWNKLKENNWKCEITGAVFDLTARSPQALSIDRIDNNKEYTPDNVRFVCWWINSSMSTWGVEKLKELIEDWQQTTNYQQIIKSSSTLAAIAGG